jgi:hypothetical protein
MYISGFNMRVSEINEQLKEYYRRLGIILNGEDLKIPKVTSLVDITSFKEVFLYS